MISRVHPETCRAWSTWKDWVIRERELREIEKDLGLTQVRGPGFLLEKRQRLDRTAAVTTGERQERDRTGQPAFVEKIRREAAHHFRDASSWADLSARLHGYGLQLEARGRGLVVTDGERMVKASRIARDTSRGELEKRLGPFADWARDVAQLREHIEREATRERAGKQWPILAMLGPAATPLRLARAAFRGMLGRTVISMAAGRLLGPAAGPVFLIGRAVEMVRGLRREGERER